MQGVSKSYHSVVIGAGIYGLYAASRLAETGQPILIVEMDDGPFTRGSFVNQARVHNGYHYPRSVSTAVKSSSYFRRFSDDYAPAIIDNFRKVYALSSNFSFTNGVQFKRFCEYADVKCDAISGWTTTMLFLSLGFSGVFIVTSIIAKYISIILQEQKAGNLYTVESLQKLN